MKTNSRIHLKRFIISLDLSLGKFKVPLATLFIAYLGIGLNIWLFFLFTGYLPPYILGMELIFFVIVLSIFGSILTLHSFRRPKYTLDDIGETLDLLKEKGL